MKRELENLAQFGSSGKDSNGGLHAEKLLLFA